MPRRPAIVTQADIARTIRALREAGIPIARVVVRSDGVSVETTEVPPTVPVAIEPKEPETWPKDLVM